MVLLGETLATGAASTCSDCHTILKLEVCKSAAGYYVGSMCKCGPYSRESGYYPSYETAKDALDSDDYFR